MPANVYECMFILDTSKVSGDIPKAAEKLHAILEKNEAEILASRPWDERRLAYPIKNQKKGLYYLTYFRTEGKNLTPMDRDFHLNELILRNLVQKIDPKLVDTMLTLARDEHAVALQNYQDEHDDLPSRPPTKKATDEKDESADKSVADEAKKDESADKSVADEAKKDDSPAESVSVEAKKDENGTKEEG